MVARGTPFVKQPLSIVADVLPRLPPSAQCLLDRGLGALLLGPTALGSGLLGLTGPLLTTFPMSTNTTSCFGQVSSCRLTISPDCEAATLTQHNQPVDDSIQQK